MKTEQETTKEQVITPWEKWKMYLALRSENQASAELISFRLHLRETVEYLDVLHPSTDCGNESMCNLTFMVDHMRELESLTRSKAIETEIEILSNHMLTIARSELDRLIKEDIGDIFGMFGIRIR